jgi:hypothetical protein
MIPIETQCHLHPSWESRPRLDHCMDPSLHGHYGGRQIGMGQNLSPMGATDSSTMFSKKTTSIYWDSQF